MPTTLPPTTNEAEAAVAPRQPTTAQRWVAALIVLGLVACLAVPASAAGVRAATTAEAEGDFLARLNDSRVGHGLAPLALDPALSADARAWSATMAAGGRLVHASTSRLTADTGRSVPAWSRAGENIGRGWDVAGLDRAFWDSAPHRANVVGDFNRVGVGVVHTDGATWVTVRFAKGPPVPAPTASVTATAEGDLWLADVHGRVFTVGAARHLGDARDVALNRPLVAMVASSGAKGYWLLAADGGVFSYGDARFHGSTGGLRLNRPVNAMAATPSGSGYWLIASDGGVFSFGDAAFHGSTGDLRLNQPIVGMAPTPTGGGYWLVASDGGLFAFGDAPFVGSAAPGRLGAPVVAMAATPTGQGYWLAAANGRVAAFGDAVHHGDLAATGASPPITRIQAAPGGGGYWLVGSDGTVHPFGSAGRRAGGPLATSGIVAAAAAT